mmetsp:Transcript_6961/g.15014  ORF Transcript_6961/g.15014 Transcript_6961/m.15014 type:complete len:86 (-) Transcript_6961:823-1080(-)
MHHAEVIREGRASYLLDLHDLAKIRRAALHRLFLGHRVDRGMINREALNFHHSSRPRMRLFLGPVSHLLHICKKKCCISLLHSDV